MEIFAGFKEISPPSYYSEAAPDTFFALLENESLNKVVCGLGIRCPFLTYLYDQMLESALA